LSLSCLTNNLFDYRIVSSLEIRRYIGFLQLPDNTKIFICQIDKLLPPNFLFGAVRSLKQGYCLVKISAKPNDKFGERNHGRLKVCQIDVED